MTRQEAIDLLNGLEAQCSAEFDVTDQDRARGQKDLRDALMALGVTEEELAQI